MGLLAKDSCIKCDSDCIVTAVFLGLTTVAGKGLQVVVEEEADKDRLDKALNKVNNAFGALAGKLPAAKVAPLWTPGQWITGGLKVHPVDGTMAAFVAEKGSEKEFTGQYLGPGAYTGMVLVKQFDGPNKGKDELQYWGSSFEVDVPKGKRKYGERLPQGGLMKSMWKENSGNSEIKGYTHGMIQAAYVAAMKGPGEAKVLELCAGEKTKKAASCFGCTTFMLAINRQPSGIHLGSANSWVPVDPANAWAMEHELQGARCDAKLKRKELAKEITDLNKRWAASTAVWMSKGVLLPTGFITDEDLQDPKVKEKEKAKLNGVEHVCHHDGKNAATTWNHKESWRKLKQVAKSPGDHLADLFLDAVGYHYSDTGRILDTLATSDKQKADEK